MKIKQYLLLILIFVGMSLWTACPTKHFIALGWKSGSPRAYTVYRSLDNKSFVPVGTSSTETFVDTSVITKKTYFYYVANSAGKSNTVVQAVP